MIEITMPQLSSSMEQGTILTWLKREGDEVEAGADLVEIEADKATITYAAESSGILEIVAAEGATLQVGATIARLGDAREAATGGEREAAMADERERRKAPP